MLVARVAPPLPDGESPQQVTFNDLPAGRQVVELAAPPGGLLVRRLAADLAAPGREVAWMRPLPFEADAGSLAPLSLMALTAARHASGGHHKAVVVVVESPTAPQAEAVLDQLLPPGAPAPLCPSIVLVVDGSQSHRRRYSGVTRIRVDLSALPSHRLRSPVPDMPGREILFRQLSASAGGLPGLLNSVLRSVPEIGLAELSRMAAGAREPRALTRAVVQHLLSDASAAEMAALEMASQLGYASERFGSLEPAVAGSSHRPWWVQLTDGWRQVDPLWRSSVASCAAKGAGAARSACLNRLVAELAEAGAIYEGIELCINAGWPGLAADLLAGEAETLLSSGRHLALIRWLKRLPADQARGRSALAKIAAELTYAEAGNAHGRSAPAHAELPPPARPAPGSPGQYGFRAWRALRRRDTAGAVASRAGPVAPTSSAMPRRRWIFRRPQLAAADAAALPGRAVPAASGALAGPADLAAAASHRSVALKSRHGMRDGSPAGEARDPARGAAPYQGRGASPNQGREAPIPIEARLFGQFELIVRGRPVPQWRGNRGRMLLAFLLLHRTRPLARDELGGAFWPDAAPNVVRNRLHVALYGLRKDLRSVCDHPIVVHGQRGFCLHPRIDVWLDIEAFDQAFSAGRDERPGSQESALTCYESALELYRGELLEDAPFEEWALARRERLRMQHLDVLEPGRPAQVRGRPLRRLSRRLSPAHLRGAVPGRCSQADDAVLCPAGSAPPGDTPVPAVRETAT